MTPLQLTEAYKALSERLEVIEKIVAHLATLVTPK